MAEVPASVTVAGVSFVDRTDPDFKAPENKPDAAAPAVRGAHVRYTYDDPAQPGRQVAGDVWIKGNPTRPQIAAAIRRAIAAADVPAVRTGEDLPL